MATAEVYAVQNNQDRGHTLAGYGVPSGGLGDALVGGRIWASPSVSYGFPDAAEIYDQNLDLDGVQYGDGEPDEDFAPLTRRQKDAAETALAQIAAVSELTFIRDDDAATIRLAQSSLPRTAYAYFPDSDEEGGDVWFGNTRGYFDVPVRGTYAWHSFLHEVGHAVGLKHGHDHGVIGAGGPLEADRDSMEWSVMTYRSFIGDPMENGYSNEHAGYAQTLMRADIAALQQLYGANYLFRSGDTRYAWNPETGELTVDGVAQGAPAANRVFETIWDGGGVDVIDASGYSGGVSIDLAPGAGTVLSADQLAFLNQKDRGDAPIYADANVYLAELHQNDQRALIENARGGAGDDRLAGNSGDNKLIGAGGDDIASGLGGSDSLMGGRGGDLLRGGGGRDFLAGQGGADVLRGGNGRDTLGGGGGDDDLDGGRGRDKLVGGGGSDALTGGRGGDLLTGGGGADVFHFAAGDGMDRITDFKPGQDLIDLSRIGADFTTLTLQEVGQGARLTSDGLSVLLQGVEAEVLTVDDFIF